MNSRRIRVVLLLIFSIMVTSLAPNLYPASAQVGTKCSKKGEEITSQGTYLKCAKSSKGLRWKTYGVSNWDREGLKKAIWSTSQKGSFPIEKFIFPIPKERVSTWSDVYSNRNGIPYQAWSSIAEVIKTSQSKLGKVTQFIGPNTKPTFPNLESAMSLVSRAFPSALEVSSTKIFQYSFTDLDWATKIYKDEFSQETGNFVRFNSNLITENCDAARKVCWAYGLIDSKSNGVILLGIIEPNTSIRQNQTFDEYARSDLGLTIAHEYFHTIQRKILGDNWYQMGYVPPVWFNEGSATFVENAVMNHESWNRYMQYRETYSKLLRSSCQGGSGYCVTVNEALLKDFLSLKHYENNWSTFPYAFKYELSARIIEILVSVGGSDSIIKLMNRMSEKQTFDKAFEYVYGIPYSDATPIISKIVANQFAN